MVHVRNKVLTENGVCGDTSEWKTMLRTSSGKRPSVHKPKEAEASEE